MKEIIFAALLIFGPVAVMLTIIHKGDARAVREHYDDIEQVVYPAWLKAHPDTPLTFPEWDALRKQDLLPK